MRDPFRVHARRVRRTLADQLAAGDTVETIERDEVNGDYWVLTSRELVQLTGGRIAARIALDDITGEITGKPIGITVQVRSRRDTGALMLTTFRKPNDLTRRLAAMLNSHD